MSLCVDRPRPWRGVPAVCCALCTPQHRIIISPSSVRVMRSAARRASGDATRPLSAFRDSSGAMPRTPGPPQGWARRDEQRSSMPSKNANASGSWRATGNAAVHPLPGGNTTRSPRPTAYPPWHDRARRAGRHCPPALRGFRPGAALALMAARTRRGWPCVASCGAHTRGAPPSVLSSPCRSIPRRRVPRHTMPPSSPASTRRPASASQRSTRCTSVAMASS